MLSYSIVFCLVVCSILCCVLSCVIFRDVLVLLYVFHAEVACYIVCCVMFGGVAHLVEPYVELFMLVGFICLAPCDVCHDTLSYSVSRCPVLCSVLCCVLSCVIVRAVLPCVYRIEVCYPLCVMFCSEIPYRTSLHKTRID